MDNSLADANLTTNNILNFLYTGPEEWREPGMPRFDWRNVFNVADQLLRMFNQYGEVSGITEGEQERVSADCQTFPGCSAGGLCCGHSWLFRQVHQSCRSAPWRLQQGLFLKLSRPLSTTIKLPPIQQAER